MVFNVYLDFAQELLFNPAMYLFNSEIIVFLQDNYVPSCFYLESFHIIARTCVRTPASSFHSAEM